MSCPCLALFLIASAFGPAIRQRTALPVPRTRPLFFSKFPYAGVMRITRRVGAGFKPAPTGIPSLNTNEAHMIGKESG
jgi:hypothetical protein